MLKALQNIHPIFFLYSRDDARGERRRHCAPRDL
jgi:hypothetical protein